MAEPKKARKLSDLGPVPLDGTALDVVAHAIKLLGVALQQVVSGNLPEKEKRSEMLAIVDRIAKLRDDAAVHSALEQLRRRNEEISQRTRGPELVDAPAVPQGSRPVAARRGRPPRSALR